MAEYLTKYPKTISFLDGLKKVVNVDSSSSVEQLHIVVKKNAQELTLCGGLRLQSKNMF